MLVGLDALRNYYDRMLNAPEPIFESFDSDPEVTHRAVHGDAALVVGVGLGWLFARRRRPAAAGPPPLREAVTCADVTRQGRHETGYEGITDPADGPAGRA